MDYKNVKIIRSARRKKTIQSKYLDGKLCIYLPNNMTEAEEKKWVDKMIKKKRKGNKYRN